MKGLIFVIIALLVGVGVIFSSIAFDDRNGIVWCCVVGGVIMGSSPLWGILWDRRVESRKHDKS